MMTVAAETKNMKRRTFPFVAVLGQEKIKNALLWNMVNPHIGGVLVCGEKGTAKSTLVRGLCEISEIMDLVELPLNTTEDCLMGNIDFEKAIKYGKKSFEPGILYRANGNVLYVDEVNLLSEHLMKSLLESASSGINIVEREGISYEHEAKFILVGSMNPEEGGLRPQFLDRFGLYVEVSGEEDIRKRTEIIRRRIAFEHDPALFFQKYGHESRQLANKIKRAKESIRNVQVTDHALDLAASIVREANCAGHRAEILIIETAKAIAAMEERIILNIDDIQEASKYVLPHRAREKEDPQQQEMPPIDDDQQDAQDDIEQEQNEQKENQNESNQPQQENETHEMPDDLDLDLSSDAEKDDTHSDQQTQQGVQPETIDDPSELFEVAKWLAEKSDDVVNLGSGRRSIVRTSKKQGRYVRYRIPGNGRVSDIAIDATLRAAAPYQLHREKKQMAVNIQGSDIRVKVRERRTGHTILFVVDASGSMGANKRMKAVKGAILSLLNDAYQKRDKVGMIAFRNQSAELLLNITRSVDLAEKELVSLPTGGRTPLSAGLDLAYETVKVGLRKDPDMMPVIVLITDGRATHAQRAQKPFDEAITSACRIAAENIKTIVVDTDDDFIRLDLASKLALALNADRFMIDELKTETLLAAVSMSL